MKDSLMTFRAHPRINWRAHPRGYTLIELIIALGLGVVIMLGLMLMFSRGSGNQQELDRTVRQIENARFAVDTLTEDVMHAGILFRLQPGRSRCGGNVYLPDSVRRPAGRAGLECRSKSG
jgi:prepilin-type N-terminal cleavage/methylation domain-containing protein